MPLVREYSTPPTMELPTSGNLTDDVVTNARDHGSDVVFSRPERRRLGRRDRRRRSTTR